MRYLILFALMILSGCAETAAVLKGMGDGLANNDNRNNYSDCNSQKQMIINNETKYCYVRCYGSNRELDCR